MKYFPHNSRPQLAEWRRLLLRSRNKPWCTIIPAPAGTVTDVSPLLAACQCWAEQFLATAAPIITSYSPRLQQLAPSCSCDWGLWGVWRGTILAPRHSMPVQGSVSSSSRHKTLDWFIEVLQKTSSLRFWKGSSVSNVSYILASGNQHPLNGMCWFLVCTCRCRLLITEASGC